MALDRAVHATTATPKNATLSIPIAAVKVTPSGAIIFTVTTATSTSNSAATSTGNYILVAHPITLGSILGDRVIILTGHIGNWEMGAAVLSEMGHKMTVIALPHKERLVNNLFNRQRTKHGVTIVPTSVAIRK